MRRDARRQRARRRPMFSFLRDLIGPSATNWLIIAAVALLFLGVATLLPALLRRLFDRNPLL